MVWINKLFLKHSKVKVFVWKGSVSLEGTPSPKDESFALDTLKYLKDTKPLYHSFMYSLVSLLSGIYPLTAMHSLLVTLYMTEYLISINQRLI